MKHSLFRAWARPACAAVVLFTFAGLAVSPASAQMMAPTVITQGPPEWTVLKTAPEQTMRGEPFIRPEKFAPVALDRAIMRDRLRSAARETDDVAVTKTRGAVELLLPTPEGTFERFLIVESPVMEPELQESYPEIRTYLGQGLTDPTAVVRIHDVPEGFGAMIRSSRGTWFIDRLSRDDDHVYGVYWLREAGMTLKNFCDTDQTGAQPLGDLPGVGSIDETTARSGRITRRFRVAIGLTGEFTQAFGGGTVQGGLSALVQTFNRVVSIYEQEFSVRMVLIGTNDRVIFTNPATDPYPDHEFTGDLLNINTAILGTNLGLSSFDLGHVMSFQANSGVAQLNALCSPTIKGAGVSFVNTAPGAAATVIIPAHEMGHQFGATHTFNGLEGGCGPNRAAATAFEPGSGSTIMSYVSICGADNLENNVTDNHLYFHSASFDQINKALATFACGVITTTNNRPPVPVASSRFVVPVNNANPVSWYLSTSATDPDGDVVSYTWEQRNLGGQNNVDTDDGVGPIIRGFAPQAGKIRFYPQLSTILGGARAVGEPILTAERFLSPMRFRTTVRDNRAGNGAVNTVDNEIATVLWENPQIPGFTGFNLDPVAASVNAGSNVNLTWNESFTTFFPALGAERLRIRLSADGGQTWPYVLANNVDNASESQQVQMPQIATPTARIRIEPTANIWFDVSNSFRIVTTSGLYAFAGQWTLNDTSGNGNANGRIDPGESSISLVLGIAKRQNPTGTNVTGVLTSTTPTVTIVDDAGTYPNAPGPAGGNPQPVFNTNDPYIINVSPSHPCGAPINLQLTINSDQGQSVLNITITTGDIEFDTIPQGPFTYTYTGAPVPIRDPLNGAERPADVLLTVPDSIRIAQTQFRFNGTRCTNQLGATTVGLEHSSIGHLRAELRSPLGETAVMFNQPGGLANRGNNMCNTLIRDSFNDPNISTGTYDFINGAIPAMVVAAAPYSNSYTPDEDFGVFVGDNAQGNWRLRVVDTDATPPTDRGNIRSFSLIFWGFRGQTCPPPLPIGIGARMSALVNGVPNVTFPEPEPFSADDVSQFLIHWANGDLEADVAGVGDEHVGIGDGQLTVDDLIAFMNVVSDQAR